MEHNVNALLETEGGLLYCVPSPPFPRAPTALPSPLSMAVTMTIESQTTALLQLVRDRINGVPQLFLAACPGVSCNPKTVSKNTVISG